MDQVLSLGQLWEDLAESRYDPGAEAVRVWSNLSRGAARVPGAGTAAAMTVEQFMAQKPKPWDDIPATLADGRNNGTMKLACSLRGRTDLGADDAIEYMTRAVWPAVQAAPRAGEFSYEEFTTVIANVWRQYPSASEEYRDKIQSAQSARPADAVYTVPVLAEAAPITEYRLPYGCTHRLPSSTMEFKDAYLTDRVQQYVLYRRFLYARGLQWMTWNGRAWQSVEQSVVRDAVRLYVVWLHGEMARQQDPDLEMLKAVTALLSKAKIEAVVQLCQGHSGSHVRDACAFDAYPDLLNTPGGIVDLRSGNIMEHNPDLLLTKITRGSYCEGLTHPDWEMALEALDAPERAWFQDRIGQAVTGHIPSDGIMPVLQGAGENGKTSLTTDGPVRALGDYADMASHKLITSVTPGRTEHSTEMADLRGQRLLIGEELAEGRSIDVTALKRIQDVGMIKARLVHRDNMTFPATHSLFATSNYEPAISETDHGTWRRLALLRFPYSFKKPGEPLDKPGDRRGDPGLKSRIKSNATGQHDAIVTWAVEGAMRWYARGMTDAPVTGKIRNDTLEWRKKSDTILGWLTEHMQFARDLEPAAGGPYCVLSTEAHEDINDWLRGRGQLPWSINTFMSRLLGHEESQKKGLESHRTRALGGLSRRPARLGIPRLPVPAGAASVITGLVFPSEPVEKELQVDAGCTRCAGTQHNSPSDSRDGKIYKVPAHRAQVPNVVNPSQSVVPLEGGPADLQSVTGPEPVTGLRPFPPQSPPVTGTAIPPKTGKPGTAAQAEREAGRTAAKAAQREQARQARIAELGGALVTLPVIVTRDLVIAACTPDDARAFLQPYLPELSVDVEHSGYPAGHDLHELRLVQLGGETGAAVLDPADPAQREVIAGALAGAGQLHAHSALADLVPLEYAGLCGREAWDKMSDTVILAKLTDPRLTDSDEAALKPLARSLLGDDYALSWRCDKDRAALFAAGGWLTGTELLTPRERSGWANVPVCETFARYAASDVMDCAAVARVLAPALPQWLTARERRFASAFVPVALHGTPLDVTRIRELIAGHESAQEAARLRVAAATGGAISNPKSSAQVPAVLAERGYALPRSARTGKPGAPKGVLEPLAAAGDALATGILEYRQHDTALGLLLRPWLSVCEHGDGRIRANIMTIEARTGRTSSRNFNMQQVSRQGGMRACVLAGPPGTRGIGADFVSVEIRVGAALSGDVMMAELIRLGDRYPDRKKEFDFHWRTAGICYGDGATKENRYNCKRVNFAKMFGSGKKSCADLTGVPLKEVSAAFDAFDVLAPHYAAWDQQMRRFVRDGGRSYPAYSGRQLWMDPAAEHGAGNTAIQGTARELAVDATLRWLDGPWGGATLLIVHDELIAFGIPAEDAQDATRYLVQCMETRLHGVAIRAEPNEPWTAWPDAS